MRTGASPERHIAFPSIPRSENAPSRKHRPICIPLIWIILHIWNIILGCLKHAFLTCQSFICYRTEQFLEIHPEYGATWERYSVLKDHPIRKLPQPLVCLNTHSIDTMNISYHECILIIQKALTNQNLCYPFVNHILLEIQGGTSREWE